MGNTSTLKYVTQELEKTVQEAQNDFNAFLVDMSQFSSLASTIEAVNQIRGIFIVLEDRAAQLYCEELGKLLNEFPTDEANHQTEKGQRISEAIVQSLAFISRYLEFLDVTVQVYPETLISEINRIRRARGVSHLPDSHFYTYVVPQLKKPKAANDFKWNDTVELELKRLRGLFQKSLLNLMHGKPVKPALTNMRFALVKIDRIAANTSIAGLFWLASVAVHAMILVEATVHANRLLLFFKLDKQIKRLIDTGKPGFNKRPAKDLVREILYIIALCQRASPQIQRVAMWYGMPVPEALENMLAEQSRILTSPGRSVMRSVSTAIKEELEVIKTQIDAAGFGASDSRFHAPTLHIGIRKISDILMVIGLTSASKLLGVQAQKSVAWVDSTMPTNVQLNAIADAIMYAESAVNRLLMGQKQSTNNDILQGIGQSHVQAARVVLLEESENGVALCRRAVTAFVDSNYDYEHLAEVLTTLDAVRGGLIFLEYAEAEKVIERCMLFVEKRLSTNATAFNSKMLENFAEALSRIEMYLGNMLNGSKEHDNLLEGATLAAGNLPMSGIH
jgi:hypothetical protein